MECPKCAGQGGSLGWPGFTCWRCSGTGQIEQQTKLSKQTNPDLTRLARHGKTELYYHTPTSSYVIFKDGRELAHVNGYNQAMVAYSSNW